MNCTVPNLPHIVLAASYLSDDEPVGWNRWSAHISSSMRCGFIHLDKVRFEVLRYLVVSIAAITERCNTAVAMKVSMAPSNLETSTPTICGL